MESESNLLADDDVKMNDLELHFCKVFRYKCFCKKLYFGYCNLFIRKDLLERYVLERIESLVGHLQFMVRQKHNLVGDSILPQFFPVRQNVWCVFLLVGQILNLFRHCPMSEHYFKACIPKNSSLILCVLICITSKSFNIFKKYLKYLILII